MLVTSAMTNDLPIPKPGTPLLSPLRYPGSKRRLVPYLRKTIEVNSLQPKLFVEPFAGGASVALQLLCDQVVESIGLADIDPLIASFWRCVFYDTDWLINAIEHVEVTLQNWRKFKRANTKSDRQRALKCLFLNRTSFSGILNLSAGPLGGKDQSSIYDIACRFPKTTLIKRIKQASSLRAKVAFVWECDWAECIRRLQRYRGSRNEKNMMLYLDPPFYQKAERLYSYYFGDKDHVALHDTLVNLPYNWLLSYDAAETIRALYSANGTKPKRVEMLYSMAGSSGLRSSQELIITNLRRLPATLAVANSR